MKTLLRDAARRLVTATRYPLPIRLLLNNTPAPVRINCGDDVEIERGCVLHGDVALEDGSKVGRGSILSGEVTVGDGTNLVRGVEVIGDVEIGKYCAVGPHTIFQEPNHITTKPGIQFKFYRDVLGSELGHKTKGKIEVGNDVWFGTNVTVLSGVSIGHGAIIGADTVVVDDVEPYSIVVGNPGRKIGWRFSEQIRDELLELAWWDWPIEKIRESKAFFEADLDQHDSIYDVLD